MDIETGLLGFTEFLAYRSARINLKIDFFRFLFSYPSFSDYLDQSVEFYDIFNDFICFMDIETGLLGFYLVFFLEPKYRSAFFLGQINLKIGENSNATEFYWVFLFTIFSRTRFSFFFSEEVA